MPPQRKLLILGSSFFCMWFLLACFCSTNGLAPTQPDSLTQDLYKTVLNLDIPAEVSNFRLVSDNLEAGFLSSAYFTYQAEPAYFDRLQAHTDFPTNSEFNEAIHPTSCTAASFPQDFGYWTDKAISLTDKACYTGTVYPYAHYFIYDPATQAVEHFVADVNN